MPQNKILKELQENKRNQKVGSEIFGVSIDIKHIKQGKPFREIVQEMKKASNENLIKIPNNASLQ